MQSRAAGIAGHPAENRLPGIFAASGTAHFTRAKFSMKAASVSTHSYDTAL